MGVYSNRMLKFNDNSGDDTEEQSFGVFSKRNKAGMVKITPEPQYTPPPVTPNDTIDTITGAAPIINSPISTIKPQQNETWIDKTGNFLEKVNNTIGMPIKSITDSATLGLNSMIRSKLFPEQQKAVEEYQAQHPIATTVGNVVGSIAPGIAIENLAVKALPSVFKDLKGATQLAARGIAGAGGYGAAEGLTEGVKNNMGVGGTLQNMGNKAYDYSLGAGIATPVLKGASNLYGNTIGFNKSLQRTSRAIDNYQFPQLREQPINLPISPLKNEATESILSRPNLQGSMNLPPLKNNVPEAPLNENELKLLPINLQQHSGELPSSMEGLNPTVNRIVSSTDKIPFKQKVSDTLNNFYKNWIDTQTNIKPFADKTGNNAYINATNTKKVGGTVDYILNDALVNPEGKKIGESLKQIGIDIPKNKENEFMDYMLHRHNIDRFKEEKPIFPDYNESQSAQAMLKHEENNPEFQQLATRLDKFLDRFRNTWLRDTGLISNDTLMDWAIKYPKYVPTFRKFTDLEKGNPMTGAKTGYVDQVTPVRAATGSSRDIINPIESIMNMVNKTVRVARRNQVGQEILNSVRKNPEELKQFAEILPATKAEAEALSNSLKSDTVEGAIDELDKGFMNPYMMKNKYDNVVTVMENGKPVFLKINDRRFLDAITSLGEQSPNNLPFQKPAQFVNNLFKTLVTQKNPIFAIKNVMRDLPTSYVYGSEKNPLKFGKQYLSAAKDVLRNKESYQQYKALGGQMGGFFKPNDLTLNKNQLLKKPGIIRSIGDFFETVNQATESAPRLAEFKRILERTGDVQKALYNAGEVTTNFSRGGNMAKAVDVYVPYFNASMQGLDRLIRAAVNNPTGFIAKGVVAATIPTAVQELWNQSTDPEGYKTLDNRTKDANFVFAQGDGNFIKIPKSRELGVLFSSLFQRLSRQAQGDSEAFKGFGNTALTNFAPANPIENNILSPVTLNLATNKDFADRPIVPDYMKDLSPRYQYDEKTSEIAKKIGDIANLSPKQVDYIIRSYTGVIGSVLQPATTTNSINKNPLKSAFTADVSYSNQAINDFYENMKKLNTVAADKNFAENIPSKKVTPEETQRNAFDTASKYMSFIRKQNINATPEEKRQAQLKVLDIAKAMNDSLKSQQNPKLLLPKLKPKGYKANQ